MNAPSADYDLVVLPIVDWGFRFQRPQQLARQFARRGRRVFYMRTTFEPRILSRGGQPPVRLIEQNIVEVSLRGPSYLSIYRDLTDNAVVEDWLEALDEMRRRYGVVEAICLVQLPFWKPLAFRLRERFGWRVVYDCMDKHAGFSTNAPMMLQEEEPLTEGSDLVLVTSHKLLEEQRRHNPHCVLAPNACDFGHFSVSLAPLPAALAGMRRPIIGYYGAVSDWFDTELVGEMAWLKPDWSFVLIGSTFGADLTPLQGLKNVHLLGEQPYAVLPAYLHAFDVCLIPFRMTLLTEATNPVKLYEYFAARKPVVAVPLPELLPLANAGLIYSASGARGMVEQVEQALHEDSVKRMARRQFAQQNTWESRCAGIEAAFQQLYMKASIIVVTHNNLHLTTLCVDSVLRNTLWPRFELIIVDNASTDGTQEYLEALAGKHSEVRLLLNERNEGFSRANNQGIQAATGDYVALLNNDTIVTRGWLARLIRHLELDHTVGMVGPVTNSVGNEARIEASYSSIGEMAAFSEQRAREYDRQSFEIKMLALFCMVARRKLFDEVGLLDERFGVGMFEDDDLAVRVKRAGHKLLCCEDVFIHHFHGATFKQFAEKEYLELFETNRKQFQRKWGVRWKPHKYREVPTS